MSKLKPIGFRLARMLVPLTKERDLMYFDGPMICLSRGPTGEPFIELVVDRDDDNERWLVARTVELNFLKYIHRKMTLRELVMDTPDGYVLVTDHGEHGLAAVYAVPVDEVPEEILPRDGALHDPSFEPGEGPGLNEQPIFLNGTWDPESLSILQRRYSQVYSFLSLFAEDEGHAIMQLHGVFERYNFRGGYVYKSAYDKIEHAVLTAKQPKAIDFHYASPGYLRFRVDPGSARRVIDAVLSFENNTDVVKMQYEAVHKILIHFKRAQEEKGADIEQLRLVFNKELATPVEHLADALGVSHSALMYATRNNIAAGSILASYFRKLQELVAMDASGDADLLSWHRPSQLDH